MSDQAPHLDSLFAAAVEIESAAERAAFLDQACGENHQLRGELERLLHADKQAKTFLERPPADLGETLLAGPETPDRAASLEARLAASFGQDAAVVIGNAGHSVLKSLGQTLDVPRVMLRESAAEGADPIVRPKSAEMPQRDSNSRYRLDGEIARGGMGAILKGRDTDLGRDLAIKVLLDQHKNKPEVVQRFVEEAQIGGQLQHPGIAPIYELGQFADKRPFFAMKLVKGETLTKLLADRKEAAAERGKFIGIFEQICQTMAYAHSRGVIHRDLKPANIMVGAFGEVQVMDWGLAKVLPTGGVADEKTAHDKQQGQSIIQTLRTKVGSDVQGAVGSLGTFGSHTQMGSVMETPAYMPPEQALGEIDHLDERADVFGLGAILCEVLTGQPPYVGNDATQVYRMATRGKLTDCFSRLDACGADAEVIAIAKQCLEIEPKDRPRDASVLAERVTGYLTSVESRLRAAEVQSATVAARAEQALQTASAERRARKLQMGFAAVVLCVLTVGGSAATWTAAVQSKLKNEAILAERTANKAREMEAEQRQLAQKEQARAESEKTRAEAAQRSAEDEKIRSLNMLADMQTERGLQAGREGNSATAAFWFANAAGLTPHDPDRLQANHLRARNWLNEAVVPVASINLPNHDLRRIAFRPRGALMLTVSGGSLRVWDWRMEVALPWSSTLADVTDAMWSPNGEQLAVAFGGGQVRLLEPNTGTELRRFQFPERIECLQWSPDGKRLAIGSVQVQIWNVESEPRLESDWWHPVKVYGLSFNRAGTRLVSACDDDQARLFAIGDPELPAPLFSPVGHVPILRARWTVPVFCDGDRRLVTFSNKHQPVWWDTTTGASVDPVWKPQTHSCHRSLAVSPDGKWVVAGGNYHCLLWNVDGGSRVLPHANQIQDAVFHPNGQSILSTCWDNTARIWPLLPSTPGLQNVAETPSHKQPLAIPQFTTAPNACVFSPDGDVAAIVASGRAVIWKAAGTNFITGGLQGWSQTLSVVRPSFDGRLATIGKWHSAPATPTFGRTLSVALLENGKPAGPSIAFKADVIDSCLCADNQSVAVALSDNQTGHLAIYDVATGAAKVPDIPLPSSPISVSARPGQHQIAVLCSKGELKIFDPQDGRLVFDLSHDGWSDSGSAHPRVAFAPDGATLVTVTPHSRVYVRDAQSGELRFAPLSPVLEGGPCRAIAISGDSRWLATAVNGKNMVQVWNLLTGEKTGAELPHPGDFYGIFAVAFSPTGDRILTGHKDGNLRQWDWKSGQLVGSPMWQAGEIYDAKFTADGRHGLSAGGSGVICWDLATSKMVAAPVVAKAESPYGVGPHQLTVVGEHVIAAMIDFPMIELSAWLGKPDLDIDSLRVLSELALNGRLQNGEILPLEIREWDDRWEKFASLRESPEAAAESLARALDEAADAAARSLVIARATRRGLLEELHALRPKSLPLLIAVALERSRLLSGTALAAGPLPENVDPKSPATSALRLTEEPAASAVPLTEILTQLREIAAKGPVDPSLMSSLAQLLTADAPRGRWIPLEPTAMKGAAETTFTRQPNGFILTGAGNSQPETYSIESRPRVKRIAALRLDVAPHASLNGGSGHRVNFHLTEVRARVRRNDGTETPVKLSRAIADYARSPDYLTELKDGPWAVLDGDAMSRWDCGSEEGKPHWLMLVANEPCELNANDKLIVELDSGDSKFPNARLGHFCLSVTDEPRDRLADELIPAVRKNDLHSDELLAAACLISGETQVALNILQHSPQSDARHAAGSQPRGTTDFQSVAPYDGLEVRRTLLRALLIATAQQQLGHRELAQQTVKAAVAESSLDPWPHSLTGFYQQMLRDFGDLSIDDIIKASKPPAPPASAAPFTDADVRRIAALPAAEQVEEVRQELKKRNPEFDGKLTPTIENDVVTGLEFFTQHVTDLSPVRAMPQLTSLNCRGDGTTAGMDLKPLKGMQLTRLTLSVNPISDLTPLQGMRLTDLHVDNSNVADLSPLEGMPLKVLNCSYTKVASLAPLKGMPLTVLWANHTKVSDLSPVKGMPLERITIHGTKITDLSPLKGMPLTQIYLDFQPQRDTELLRSIGTLENINGKPAAEFWKENDAKD